MLNKLINDTLLEFIFRILIFYQAPSPLNAMNKKMSKERELWGNKWEYIIYPWSMLSLFNKVMRRAIKFLWLEINYLTAFLKFVLVALHYLPVVRFLWQSYQTVVKTQIFFFLKMFDFHAIAITLNFPLSSLWFWNKG